MVASPLSFVRCARQIALCDVQRVGEPLERELGAVRDLAPAEEALEEVDLGALDVCALRPRCRHAPLPARHYGLC